MGCKGGRTRRRTAPIHVNRRTTIRRAQCCPVTLSTRRELARYHVREWQRRLISAHGITPHRIRITRSAGLRNAASVGEHPLLHSRRNISRQFTRRTSRYFFMCSCAPNCRRRCLFGHLRRLTADCSLPAARCPLPASRSHGHPPTPRRRSPAGAPPLPTARRPGAAAHLRRAGTAGG